MIEENGDYFHTPESRLSGCGEFRKDGPTSIFSDGEEQYWEWIKIGECGNARVCYEIRSDGSILFGFHLWGLADFSRQRFIE